MITLTLLHPLKPVPVQYWTFKPESVIRIGRSVDNDVVLYSAVVSRRHLEIRRNDSDWEIVNLGSNGTYINGKRINKTIALDGMIIRLASSGPQIKITIEESDPQQKMKLSQATQSSNVRARNISKDTVIN